MTLVIGQFKDFLGLAFPAGAPTVETMDKLQAVAQSIGTANWQAFVVGAVCLAILFAWPKVSERIPGSLVALIVGIALVSGFGMQVSTIGDLYVISSDLPEFRIPQLNVDLLARPASQRHHHRHPGRDRIAPVLRRRRQHDQLAPPQQHGAGCAGRGQYRLGAIRRNPRNRRHRAHRREREERRPHAVAGMTHALVLLIVLVFFMPYAALIPMPTIAAILLHVAYNMSGWRNFAHLCKTASRGAVATLLLTFALTVVFDLVVAIAVGMLITVVLFMKMVSEETEVRGWKYYCDEDSEVTHLRELPESVRVYEINGPMFFGMTDRISDISVKSFTKYLIIRMRGVPSLDSTGMNALETSTGTAARTASASSSRTPTSSR